MCINQRPNASIQDWITLHMQRYDPLMGALTKLYKPAIKTFKFWLLFKQWTAKNRHKPLGQIPEIDFPILLTFIPLILRVFIWFSLRQGRILPYLHPILRSGLSNTVRKAPKRMSRPMPWHKIRKKCAATNRKKAARSGKSDETIK